MLKTKILLLIFLCFCVQYNVQASSASGLELNADKFRIKITYNDAAEVGEKLEYLRVPSGLLFDLIYVLQNNFSEFSQIDSSFWFDISTENNAINVLKYNATTQEFDLLSSNKYPVIGEVEIRTQICNTVGLDNCLNLFPSSSDAVYLFEFDDSVSLINESIVLFGAFPSEQMDVRFALNKGKADCKKLEIHRITKDDISQYFKPLE